VATAVVVALVLHQQRLLDRHHTQAVVHAAEALPEVVEVVNPQHSAVVVEEVASLHQSVAVANPQ
jgi:hypothetical protein